ncbi:ATP-grasp domain-containing protein [Burkholderia anthina]|uniref:Carbamoyl-phosphate synthase large subunit n=1 Tax=Burkholderia anthina TaxID=179879 RepID=A0AAW3PSQ8_9BURK|nr:ATP-grasp domain-containing protein [Burkholderia anthina]KWZ31648.1 carbamoyl-phosphate synthase large subunit [Burkholderia anthina]
MRQDAVLFVQIEGSLLSLTSYRDYHFEVARKMGLACLTAVVRRHVPTDGDARAARDDTWWLDSLSVESLLRLLEYLDAHYDVKAVFCYAGQASAYGEVGAVVAEVCRMTGRVHSPSAAVAACNNKFLMRAALEERGVRSIRHAMCSDVDALREAADTVGYPLIAKPPYGAGSAFTAKCRDWNELRDHYQRFTAQHGQAVVSDYYGMAHDVHARDGAPVHYEPGKSILLEQYIDGVEGSVECVIVDDQVYPVLINEKLILTEKRGTVLENLLISPPVSFPAPAIAEINRYAIDCLEAIGLRNAIVHLEFRLSPTGPIVIEINPRLGGLYVNAALKDIAGLDPYELYLLMLTRASGLHERLRSACERAADGRQHYSMFALFPEASGTFNGIRGLDSVVGDPAIIECKVACPVGSEVRADIEENYLLKGWAAVNGRDHAIDLYDRIVRDIEPEIVS